MIKRVFVLLLATAALGGSLYALRGKKNRRQEEESPAGPLLLNPPPVLLQLSAPAHRNIHVPHPHLPHLPHPNINAQFTMTPRVAGLVVVALALTLGAYLGLGKGAHIETASAFGRLVTFRTSTRYPTEPPGIASGKRR